MSYCTHFLNTVTNKIQGAHSRCNYSVNPLCNGPTYIFSLSLGMVGDGHQPSRRGWRPAGLRLNEVHVGSVAPTLPRLDSGTTALGNSCRDYGCRDMRRLPVCFFVWHIASICCMSLPTGEWIGPRSEVWLHPA